MAEKKKKRKVKVRLPLPQKPGGPMSEKKGDKGYDRKHQKKEVEWEEDNS